MVRIGINPLTWTNDDLPELGDANSLETCLSEATRAGYDGVELGRKFPRDPAVLGPILTNHKLELVSGWYSARLLERSVADEIKAMQPHLTLLKSLGDGPRSIAELSRGGEISRQAMTKHLRVLEDAGLVRSGRVGREVRFRLEREALAQAQEFLSTVSAQWEDALGRLKAHVESR